ncbi:MULTISPECIES: hypothetical protein [unclassified Tenacibaculum]|uniref:hypothetical protein n=1 Tax=unclassified Tenacibaculum TaxID=2635139 RepID=UPI001F299931|nr:MULTISPECIES: hypothetical protein [unclassified Tenacibaculum]MCF2876075.1 hypothetical protein [Tenacibaculum sp. Cn5-1]MCF2936150.1 hypothetical protein [Tenacibaculum sp. Cn5-34]MCG7512711.1 hypothetical protein [Tenacibaculum sp. Cn5-46]
MELTDNQIQRISNYLDAKGVKLIDFRIEIFDHIISEIEQKLTSSNSDFDTIFQQVTDNWNKQLNSNTSFLLGWYYSAPKTVIIKAKSIYKKLYTKTLLFISIPLLLVMFLNPDLYKTTLNLINSNGLFISYLFSFVSGFIIYKSRKEINKTTYNFLIKTQEVVLFFGAVLITMYFFDMNSIELLLLFIFSNCYLIVLYTKHLKEKEKYKLLVG